MARLAACCRLFSRALTACWWLAGPSSQSSDAQGSLTETGGGKSAHTHTRTLCPCVPAHHYSSIMFRSIRDLGAGWATFTVPARPPRHQSFLLLQHISVSIPDHHSSVLVLVCPASLALLASYELCLRVFFVFHFHDHLN